MTKCRMAVFEEIIQPINEFGDSISEIKTVKCGGEIIQISEEYGGCTKCGVMYWKAPGTNPTIPTDDLP